MLIYLIKNRITGKEYVGQTIRSLSERWREHCRPSKSKKCTELHNAITKHGREAFVVSVLAETDSLDELNRSEAHHIEGRNTITPFGYNLTTGGENYIRSSLTRARMAKASTGRKYSDESKLKMSLSRRGKLSEKQAKHLRQMQNAHIGSHHTQEWREACSKWMQGNKNGH
jgi:group I intron endonuclease